MAVTRRSFLRAAALTVAAMGSGIGSASATAPRLLATGSDAEPLRLAVAYPRTAAQRAALAAFDDTHAIVDGGVELLLWPGDRARLAASGIPFEVTVDDLVARDRANAEAAAQASSPNLATVPGGPTDYRDLDEIYEALAQIARDAAEYPGDLTAEVVTMPHASFEGREIKHIELYLGDGHDGRGVAYIDGVHHAREWPAAEYPLIFARWLVDELFAGNARVRALLETVRVRICPVINVDGFVYSRSWDDTVLDNSLLGIVAGGQGAYVRKTKRNNPVTATGVDSPLFYGVDPNRNYAYLWGGTTGSLVGGVDFPLYASTSSNPVDQTYYGTEPFSEPETLNNRELFLSTNVITYLSHHTQGRLILRPWGHTTDPAPDEALLVDLGARMSAATQHDGFPGYESKIGLGLYPTLGTSNDWAYAATGTLGYVIENSLGQFHPPYGSLHGPGNVWPHVIEMCLIACEEAAQPRACSTLQGTVRDASGELVPAALVLEKSFTTPYADLQAQQGTGQLTAGGSELAETLRLQLSTAGTFTWRVNPSTRPIAELGGEQETYTLTATTADGRTATAAVLVARGESATVDLVVS